MCRLLCSVVSSYTYFYRTWIWGSDTNSCKKGTNTFQLNQALNYLIFYWYLDVRQQIYEVHWLQECSTYRTTLCCPNLNLAAIHI